MNESEWAIPSQPARERAMPLARSKATATMQGEKSRQTGLPARRTGLDWLDGEVGHPLVHHRRDVLSILLMYVCVVEHTMAVGGHGRRRQLDMSKSVMGGKWRVEQHCFFEHP